MTDHVILTRNPEFQSFIGFCDQATATSLALDQLGISACGATAVLSATILCNVIRKEDLREVDTSMCIVRRRDETGPLPQYLLSRYDAGCTGEEVSLSFNALVKSIRPLDHGPRSEFRPYSEIDCTISEFIRYHFSAGHILIATLNLQLIGNDAWHHQLVYGIDVDTDDVYMMNPLEKCPLHLVEKFISTPSILLIRREDILSRIDRPGADQSIYSRPNWDRFKIQQQIVDVLADATISHIVIPAGYKGGFTIIYP